MKKLPNERYLIDNKVNLECILDNDVDIDLTDSNGKKVNIGRYGYWKVEENEETPHVKETNKSLDKLLKKYGNIPIIKIKREPKA